MKFLKNIEKEMRLDGVRVLVRLDLNVPVKDGIVVDDYRIRKTIPTINFLKDRGAKIILMSHIETKEGKATLEPIAFHFKRLGVDCNFIKNYKNALEEIKKMERGDVMLLENLRSYKGEIENNNAFAMELASLGDVYVNEAFAVSHREHTSVSAITEFIDSYAGLLFEKEIEHLSSAFNPDHPFLFILGGAKFETKLPLIEKFINIADKVFIAGALANDFFKEMGKDVGKSVVSGKDFQLSRFIGNPKLILPVDTVVSDGIIYDIGEKSMKILSDEVEKAKYILWNGPLGAYEQGFREPTHDLARMIARATSQGTKSILGGGDTLATIADVKLEDQFTFVSTGGGAMLEFLAKGTLPGIEALK